MTQTTANVAKLSTPWGQNEEATAGNIVPRVVSCGTLPQAVELGANPLGGGADQEQIERFLVEMYSGMPGLVQTVKAEGSGTQKTLHPRFHSTDEDGIEEAVLRLTNAGALPNGVGLYTQVTTCIENPNDTSQEKFGQFGRKRGGVANTSHLLCLWNDIDFGEDGHADARGDRLPNPPDAATAHEIYVRAGLPDASIIVNSGGGLYELAILDEPFDMTDPAARRRAESVSKRWQQLIEKTAREMGYHYGVGVSNLDRILRVPGTVNAKVWNKLRRATAQYTGVRYSFAELEETINRLYPEPVAPARPDGQAYQVDRWSGSGSELPGNDFNERGDWQRDILGPAGMTHSHSCGDVTYWVRPGKEVRDGHGFSLNHKPDLLFAWTDGTALTPQRYYDKFSAFTHLFHGGDFKAAAQALRSMGYGAASAPAPISIPAQASAPSMPPAPRPSDYVTVDDGEGGKRQVLSETYLERVAAYERGEITEDDLEDTDADENAIPGRIPPEFWERREVLRHIRQAAHAQCCSSDVFLYAYMARMSSMIDHRIRVNTGAKQPVCPNIYVGIVAKSGTNKSSSVAGAGDLTYAPEHRDFLDGVPIGTGEGMAEGLMGTVMEDDPDGKTLKDGSVKQVTVRKQVRHNIFFDVDEGETLIRLGSRDGSSLWPSIRSAWTGGPLGQLNATAERNRVIPAKSYTISMIVGFQQSNALRVIADNETGTAQRFVWCNAVDPDIPMDPIDWPGELPYNPQEMTLSLEQLKEGPRAQRLIEMPADIKRHIRQEIVMRGRGGAGVDDDPLNAHANLSKVKLSALLALMEGRDEINGEDWELAEILWAASCELRDHLIDAARREAQEKLREKNEADLQKAVTIHASKAASDRSVEIRARWVWEKVKGGMGTMSELNKALSSKMRPTLRGGVELALVRDWIVMSDDGELSAGPSQPGGTA